jgi:hypothetical protein
VLKVAAITGAILVSASPEFAPPILSKTTDSADANLTSANSQTAVAAHAATPVRERIGFSQNNMPRPHTGTSIGESQPHSVCVSGCGERCSEGINCVVKDRRQ